MKLIIQIPCFNEESTLGETVQQLPRQVEGFDSVEFMIIDDGSTDRTVQVARDSGVDHIVSLNGHQGLARGFMAGLTAGLERGADVIVNTDADNQYVADDIPALVAPVRDGTADIAIGERPIASIKHFSFTKRVLQRVGSWVVRTLSNTAVQDAPSGFRAMNREAALRLNVFGGFTYTLETIIQAGRSNLRVTSVPIRVNGPTRPSRLFRNTPMYIYRSIETILRVYTLYRPTKIFGLMSLLCFIPAAFLSIRYIVLAIMGEGAGHIQSVIASGVLGVCSVFAGLIGVIAHLHAANRVLLEEIRYMLRRQGLG